MHPAEINRQKLLHRFLQYVRVGSAADPASPSYPSSVGQLELGNMLVEQLLEMGISDAHQDEHGLIWGTVPSNVEATVDRVLEEFPGVEGRVTTVVQYRNMADVLRGFPKAIELAEQAFADLKFPSRRDSIRGGTDGALMSALGLPTPNLSVGQFNIHSVREFASLDHMVQAAQHVIRLVELWSLEGLGD